MSLRMTRFFVVCSLAVFLLSACASSDSSKDPMALPAEQPVEQIYEDAQDALEIGNYDTAARLFNEVERLYPYSEWATQAQLMAAYAYYEGQRYDEAILALERFIQLYPGSKSLDYAYYLNAMAHYEQITDVERDQEMTRLALRQLNILIDRFPDSDYARDAQFKRDLTLDHLAGKEMEVGRYYLTRGHYQAGITRFMNVIEEYQTTTHVPEALHRLVESYLALGIKQEAVRIAAILGHNYPGSQWYEDTYRLLDPTQREKLLEERGFLDRTVETIFRPQ